MNVGTNPILLEAHMRTATVESTDACSAFFSTFQVEKSLVADCPEVSLQSIAIKRGKFDPTGPSGKRFHAGERSRTRKLATEVKSRLSSVVVYYLKLAKRDSLLAADLATNLP